MEHINYRKSILSICKTLPMLELTHNLHKNVGKFRLFLTNCTN